MITEEKIWEYLDGRLNKNEVIELEYAIANDVNMSALFNEVSEMHKMLGGQYFESPSMAFTENVMRSVRIQSPYAKSAEKNVVIPFFMSAVPYAAVFLIALLFLFINPANDPHAYHISTHLVNIAKLIFVLTDSVLLVLFIEQWLYFKGKIS